MKAILCVVVATFFYACANVVLQRKLPGNPAIVTAAISQMAMIILSWVILGSTQQTRLLSDQYTWKWCLVVGILFFIADLSYFQAYALKISAKSATTILLGIPVFSAIINAALYAEKLKTWHYAAFFCAVLMVLCLAQAGEEDEH